MRYLLLLLLATPALAKNPHYDVRARLFPAESRLSADVTITNPASERDTTFLLGAGYTIARSTTPATPAGPLQKIVVPRGTSELRLLYSGPLGPTGNPPLNVISPDLIELNLDAMWFPVAEGFTTRFTAKVVLDGVPPDLVIVAPGAIRRSGERVIIERTHEDFDVTFVAMKGLQRRAAQGFELYSFDPSNELSQWYLRHGAAALQFLESWFGDIPGGRVRMVVVRRERISGYARTGYVVVTENSRGGESGSAKFVAHELAHAWWAPVDPGTDNRWLQESIAEYIALRYVEQTLGSAARDELLAPKRETAKAAKPILGGERQTDAELYAKGPLLLFELEERVGRAKLDRVLATLARRPPSVSAEFFRALADVAGADAAQAFEQRLRE
jgi:hypothetical protein